MLVPGFDSRRAHMPCSFGSIRHWWGKRQNGNGKGKDKVAGGGSCFQLCFAAKSGVHVRYSLAGQDTRLSSERPGFKCPLIQRLWVQVPLGILQQFSDRGLLNMLPSAAEWRSG